MLPLSVSWETQSLPLQTPDYARGVRSAIELIEGVVTVSSVTQVSTIRLRNTAQDRRAALGLTGQMAVQPPEKLENIRFYLTGDPTTVEVLMTEWPVVHCGVSISMDLGLSWTLLSGVSGGHVGFESDPSSWIPLAGTAVASDANNGELRSYMPYDTATLMLRVTTPVLSSMMGLFQYQLGISYDVV